MITKDTCGAKKKTPEPEFDKELEDVDVPLQ